MKSLLRENRQPRGSVAKVDRILKDVKHVSREVLPPGSSGAKIFAVWRSYPRKRRDGRNPA